MPALGTRVGTYILAMFLGPQHSVFQLYNTRSPTCDRIRVVLHVINTLSSKCGKIRIVLHVIGYA